MRWPKVKELLLASALCALLLEGGCGGSERVASTSADVASYTPSASEIGEIETAYDKAFSLPSTCLAAIAPGYKFASVQSTASDWALATFVPAPGCTEYLGGPTPPQTIPVAQVRPFTDDPTGRTAVSDRETFLKLRGGAWTAVAPSGQPFPCPPSGNMLPGDGNGAFPKDVLDVWGLHYAQDCARAFFPVNPP